MHFEGITLTTVIQELQGKIAGGFIQKVHQPLPDLIILHIYSGERRQLLISIGQKARLHLTEQQYENPPTPSAFCMLLRKYLKGGRLEGITQPGLERIADLLISRHGERYTLRAELMGHQGNVILLRGDGILGALKPKVGRRAFLPHTVYEPPPQQSKLDPLRAPKGDFLAALEDHSQEPIKKALLDTIEGIGPRTSREIAVRAALDLERNVSSLSPQEREALWGAAVEFFTQVAEGELQPRVYFRDGGPIDATPFPYEIYGDLEERSCESISEALDLCHRERRQEPFERLSHELAQVLKERLKKTERAIQEVSKDLEQAQRYEDYREQGDLLMAHLAEIRKGATQIEVEDFVHGGKKVISLDPALSPIENAKRYYERSKKLKRGVEKLAARRRELEMEREYLEELEMHLEQAESLDELKELQSELEAQGYIAPAKGPTRPPQPCGPRRYNFDGFTVLVGRNGRQNDQLIRGAHREDWWLHAKDRPGAHVIVKGDRKGTPPPEEVLMRAAQLAAYYSKGRTSSKVPVAYTRVKYLRKPKGARPGLVIVTHEEGTLTVAPKEAEG